MARSAPDTHADSDSSSTSTTAGAAAEDPTASPTTTTTPNTVGIRDGKVHARKSRRRQHAPKPQTSDARATPGESAVVPRVTKVGPGAHGRWVAGAKGKTSIRESKLSKSKSSEMLSEKALEARQKLVKRNLSEAAHEERGTV